MNIYFMDKNSIKTEAKKIMDNFMDAMQNIQVDESFEIKKEVCFREEGDGDEFDEDFQQRFLKNAPKTSGTAIVSRKGDWTK